jgi:hypothetical protein
MTRSYEPAADVALDEGTEPPYPCPRCDAPLTGDEVCPVCEDEALLDHIESQCPKPDDDGGRMDWAFERERDL